MFSQLLCVIKKLVPVTKNRNGKKNRKTVTAGVVVVVDTENNIYRRPIISTSEKPV